MKIKKIQCPPSLEILWVQKFNILPSFLYTDVWDHLTHFHSLLRCAVLKTSFFISWLNLIPHSWRSKPPTEISQESQEQGQIKSSVCDLQLCDLDGVRLGLLYKEVREEKSHQSFLTLNCFAQSPPLLYTAISFVPVS